MAIICYNVAMSNHATLKITEATEVGDQTGERLPDPAETVAAADAALDLTVESPTDESQQLQHDVEAFLADFSYSDHNFPSPAEIMQREKNPRTVRAFIEARRNNPSTPDIVKLADERYLRGSGRKSRRAARSDESLRKLLADSKAGIIPSKETVETIDDEPSVTPVLRLTPEANSTTPAPDTQSDTAETNEANAPIDDEFIEDYKKQSQAIAKLRSELANVEKRRGLDSRYIAEKKQRELHVLEKALHDKFFNGIDQQDQPGMKAREDEIYEAMKAANERKIDEATNLREAVTAVSKDLDTLIEQYQSETDPAKADKLWKKLERAYAQYKDMAADFNLRNDALSGLIGTPLFEAMGPVAEIARATVRNDETLKSKDAEYLHIPPTTADKRAAAKAEKAAAKAQHKYDTDVLKAAVKKIPDWFRPVDKSDEPAPDTAKSDAAREKQWNKLLKSFRKESSKYSKHERGDALGSAYQLVCQMELKWRGRDDFDSLTVADKEDYQKDMDRLLHDHDGFAWKVLGSNKINGRDLSISDLYDVISQAEFKNTLRESRKQEMGGVALMFAAAPSTLYRSSMALLSSVIPQVDDLHWFINAKNQQHTIDSLSRRTAKGLGLDSTPIATDTALAA